MASIIRNGQVIDLTPEEVARIRKEEHIADIRFDVEQEVECQEGNDWLDFSDWSENGQDYKSSDEARADFIEYVVESIIEKEELYDEDPDGYRANIGDIVSDLADEMGYWRG